MIDMRWRPGGHSPRVRSRRGAAAVALCLLLSGCGPAAPGWQPAGSPQAGPAASPSLTVSPSPSAVPQAPVKTFPVGTRTLKLSRAGRSLPTTVWYPATGKGTGTPVAAGRFPLVIFSHGLRGLPAYHEGLTTRLAAAGFVVAAPTYPFTRQGASPFNPVDTANQPADASYVVTELLRLDGRAGDLFAGHLDPARVGAAGYSAGGFTTAGLLAGERDTRIKGAIVIAGGPLGTFSGPSTPVLFIHGDQDETVPYSVAHGAYTRLSWPKAFLTELGQGHGGYLGPGAKGFDQAMRTMLDFLRWTLYGDEAAKRRLPGDATAKAVTRYEAEL